MMDPSHKLKQTLAELQDELRTAGKIDPATRNALEEAIVHIQGALAAAKSGPSEPLAPPPHGMTDRLRAAVAKFEATHPTLAGTLERLIDLMASAGI